MGIKILLADDSVTAQNMGKKILSEAGHEVVTVSNGAAAAKKIAELKPELVLLDVFMPGYSGLELCEKLRNAAETSKLPVLLTVGKLEPHSPQDVARVKADGVIIKPFEASDLTSAVERLAQKLKPGKPQATATPAAKSSAASEFKDETYLAWKKDAPTHGEDSSPSSGKEPAEYEATMRLDSAAIAAILKAQENAETPSAAPSVEKEFSVATPAHSAEEFFVHPAATQPELPTNSLPAFGTDFAEAAASEIPSYMSQYLSREAKTESAPASMNVAEATADDLDATVVFSKKDILQTFEKPSELHAGVEPAEGLELTAAAPVPDVPVAKEAGFEPTLQAVDSPTFVMRDPAFVSDPHAANMDFVTQFGTSEPGLADDLIQSMASPAGEKISPDDFEARLNAAMTAFAEPSSELPELATADSSSSSAVVEFPNSDIHAHAEPRATESDLPQFEPGPVHPEIHANVDAEASYVEESTASEAFSSSSLRSEIELPAPFAASDETVPSDHLSDEVSSFSMEPMAKHAASEEEPAIVEAVSSTVVTPSQSEPGAISMEAVSAPETDEAIIRQMREAFSDLPIDHSHLQESVEPDPAPMAMAAAAAAAAPVAAPSTVKMDSDAEMEIARALSAAVGGELPLAAASNAGQPEAKDANNMAEAVESVMRRELPNLVWKIMAELDLRKRS